MELVEMAGIELELVWKLVYKIAVVVVELGVAAVVAVVVDKSIVALVGRLELDGVVVGVGHVGVELVLGLVVELVHHHILHHGHRIRPCS